MRYIFNRPLFVSGVTVLLLVAVLAISTVRTAFAATETSKSGERLLVIHDGSAEQGFLTKAGTVRDALQENGVTLDKNDLVEPSLDEELVANSYDINIYRARPITIVDGAIRKRIMSAYRTPSQIVEHAGMELHDEDTTDMRLPNGTVTSGAEIELAITRATRFTFVLYGKKTTAYTQAKTVAEMLKEKNVTLAKDDSLSLAVSVPLTADMVIELWREGKQTVTEDAEVAFDTEKIQDADRDLGFHEVVTPGEVGKRTVTYEVEMKNGQEVSRHEIQSVTLKEPVKQVEIIGIKANLPSGSHEDWMAAAGIAPSDYGYINYIVMREGGWEPCKVQGGAIDCTYAANGGRMGYGMVQATPGVKMASAGSDWATNPITQLKWATGYANGRYGGWSGAYNYWISHHNW